MRLDARQVVFHVIGIPQPKGSKKAFPRAGGGCVVVDDVGPVLRKWEKSIKAAAQAEMATCGFAPFAGPVTVDATFRLDRPTSAKDRRYPHVPPDIDKLLRA